MRSAASASSGRAMRHILTAMVMAASVHRVRTANPGAIPLPVWPAPSTYTAGKGSCHLATPFAFQYAHVHGTAGPHPTPVTVTTAFARYADLTFPHRATAIPTALPSSEVLHGLVVKVQDSSEGVPQHGFDESYTLTVPSGCGTMAAITAQTVHGPFPGAAFASFRTASSSVKGIAYRQACSSAYTSVKCCEWCNI